MRRAAIVLASLSIAGCAVVAHPVSAQASAPEPRVHHTHWIEPTATPSPTAIPTDIPATPDATSTPAPPRPTTPPQPVPQPPLPVATPNYTATTQQILVNQDRAAAGLSPLAWSPCLGANAQAIANRIAAAGALNEPYSDLQADLNCGLGGSAGENQGWCSCGADDGVMNTALMNSPDHKANILGNYHWIGTAWAIASNGYGYLAEEFG